MAKTAKAAAPKKKPAPAKATKKAAAKKPGAKKVPAKAVKALAAKASVAKATAGAKGKAPAKASPPAKPVAAKTAPAAVKASKAPTKPVKPTAVKSASAQAAGTSVVASKAVEAKKADLKVVEPKATPTLMSKVADSVSGKVSADEGNDEAAPKKKRGEKDPLAGLDKIADPVAKWEALSAKASLIPTAPYKMSSSFEPKTGLQHKVLGWGYVLTAQNDRLEVLFKDGVRILISNYKAP